MVIQRRDGGAEAAASDVRGVAHVALRQYFAYLATPQGLSPGAPDRRGIASDVAAPHELQPRGVDSDGAVGIVHELAFEAAGGDVELSSALPPGEARLMPPTGAKPKV